MEPSSAPDADAAASWQNEDCTPTESDGAPGVNGTAGSVSRRDAVGRSVPGGNRRRAGGVAISESGSADGGMGRGAPGEAGGDGGRGADGASADRAGRAGAGCRRAHGAGPGQSRS